MMKDYPLDQAGLPYCIYAYVLYVHNTHNKLTHYTHKCFIGMTIYVTMVRILTKKLYMVFKTQIYVHICVHTYNMYVHAYAYICTSLKVYAYTYIKGLYDIINSHIILSCVTQNNQSTVKQTYL